MDTHKCRWCGKEIKIKKPKWKAQTIANKKKNCPENPESRWYKGKREKEKEEKQPEQPQQPKQSQPETEPIESDKIEGEGSATIDQSGVFSWLQGMQGENETGEPTTEQSMIPTVDSDLPDGHIPANVIGEWVVVLTTVNFDLVLSYSKKHNLKKPHKLDMSSHTSRWLGKMISQELGPVESSWGIILTVLSPYILFPWASVIMQKSPGVLDSILSRFRGSDHEEIGDEE